MQNTLTERLKNVIHKFSDREAVKYSLSDRDVVIKYFELNNYSNLVAENLSKVLKTSYNQFIGICLDVTFTYPCIINGILSSGCAFVPLDYLNGLRWNENVLKKLNIKFIITNKINCDLIRKTKTISQFLILDEELYITATENEDSTEEWKLPMAYSIQTSGSTGTPKIIKVPHQCILPNVLDLSATFKMTESDEVLFSSPPTFDPSVVEMFLALTNGACLRIIEPDTKRDHVLLGDMLFPHQGGNKLTILPMTPSLFKQWPVDFLSSRVFSGLSNIRILLLGGEKCPSSNELKDWKIRKGIKVYNIYGISEVSCWAAVSQIWPPPLTSPSMGMSHSNQTLMSQSFISPLSETILQVRNKDENSIGTMFIGSSSRICLIDDEDFDIFKDQEVFRDTGDLFEEKNGVFTFICRSGDVVKRWGIKTTLSALENHALSQGSVKNAVCVAKITDESTSIGLFIEPKGNFNLDEFYEYFCRNGSRTHPDSVIILQKIPVTSHGKINKKFLLELMSKEKSCLDSTDLFNLLWRQYTLCERVIVDKGFLSSGGNSFSALQFVSEFKQLWQLPDNFLSLLLQDSTFNRCLSEVISLSRVNDLSSTKGKKRKIVENDSSPKSLKGSPLHVRDDMTYLINHSGHSPKHNNCEFSFNLTPNWKYCLGKCVDCSPTIVELEDDKAIVIIGSHSGKVAVIDCDNGNLISEVVLPDRIESTASVHRLKDKFTLGCYDGCIYTFSFNCEKIWCFKTRDIVKSSPITSGDSVICGSYDKFVYCLESETGELIWKRPVGGQVLSKPLIVGNNVIVSTLTGSVMSLTLDDGTPAWTTSLASPVFSSPVLLSNKIVVADVLGNLGWLHIHTGHKLSEYKAGGNIFSSVIPFNDCILMCCDDYSIYCLKGNQLVWKTKLDSRLVSTPCLFTVLNRKFVAVVSSEGKLYLLDANTGRVLASHSLPGQVFSSPSFIFDSLLVGCRDNFLHSIKINTVC